MSRVGSDASGLYCTSFYVDVINVREAGACDSLGILHQRARCINVCLGLSLMCLGSATQKVQNPVVD